MMTWKADQPVKSCKHAVLCMHMHAYATIHSAMYAALGQSSAVFCTPVLVTQRLQHFTPMQSLNLNSRRAMAG